MMRTCRHWPVVVAMLVCAAALGTLAGRAAADDFAVELPEGVDAVWDMQLADRQSTATRERVCLNGLWRWQPADSAATEPPQDHWGYFKVPGCWPGISDYMQKDCQTVFAHPAWAQTRLADLTAAWYEREFAVPEGWAGRRVVLRLEYVNSLAKVFVDGKAAGDQAFPGGELDLTAACGTAPGKHRLSLLVVALPLKAVLLSYHDSAAGKTEKGSVARRGLCGDVFLVSEPPGPRIADVRVETSVRKQQIGFDVALAGLAAEGRYRLVGRIDDDWVPDEPKSEYTSPPFTAGDVKGGRYQFRGDRFSKRLWDLHTPGNQYRLNLTLTDVNDQTLDAALPIRFGFREFWIDGRDFYLNGSRIWLSALPLDNAQVERRAGELRRRLREPRAAEENRHQLRLYPQLRLRAGIAPELCRSAAGRRQGGHAGLVLAAAFQPLSLGRGRCRPRKRLRPARRVLRPRGPEPSVGRLLCDEPQRHRLRRGHEPRLDRRHSRPPRPVGREQREAGHPGRSDRPALDPSRIVYHHASGNLGPLHASNFYPNFVPIQELSDWFEHWATKGVKPVFLCEYGAPFTWDWGMYRGWFRGKREFGSAEVPWEFCVAEWNAQFLGDRAFKIGEPEKADLRWEAQQVRGRISSGIAGTIRST